MPRSRSAVESAAGKVISAVRKVWTYRLGTDQAAMAEATMNLAHDLQAAVRKHQLTELLSGRTVRAYLGEDRISSHPGVDEAVRKLERALLDNVGRAN